MLCSHQLAAGVVYQWYNLFAMTGEAQSAPTTFLYTDLVNSTELLSRLGDERAQRVFQTHHKLLREATEANGGQEVKWQGDGVMDAFASTAAAVRCAISMQQSASRPIGGERLEVRVGLNVGEALGWEEADYFGSPVVVAARLCHDANGGQILCSSVVVALLSGRQAFQFRAVGDLELKGIPEPVAASEVLYEPEQPGARLRHTPFVGRESEAAKLSEALQETTAGRGGLVMLVGEPGIGKTRLAEEFAELARHDGATVLWGRCYEGEWAPPYGPFAEAIQQYARTTDVDELRDDLGNGAGAIARIAPALRERLPDIPEPATLEPDEERFRLLDAVSQFLIAASRRAPMVLVLDDLHWADKGTIAMLRHVARFAPSSRTLLLGAYRDVELDRQHPLADALGDLQREANYERVVLNGLKSAHVGELLAAIGEQDLPDELADAISAETDGNPFFIRAVLLDLVDRGALYLRDGKWTTDAKSVKELGIPEGVRQVIGRRLSRLSDDANRLLTAASASSGTFRFDIAAEVAGLQESAALDATDEALEAQIVRPGDDADTFDFVHANIRQTLYTELSPPRQVRLHRQVAEAIEQAYSDKANEHAAELAYQYHRSSTLSGAERGVDYAIAAADQAGAAYAHDQTATFLRMALELLPEGDPRSPRILARLGLALAWTLSGDEAVKAASEAGNLIAVTEGGNAAADYLAEAVGTIFGAGFQLSAWSLASQGLRYLGDRRDRTWAYLKINDLMRRVAEGHEDAGILVDTQERREIADVHERLPPDQRMPWFEVYESRDDALARAGDDADILMFWAGDYRRSLPLWQQEAEQAEQQGRLAGGIYGWARVARCHNSLGDFTAAREAFRRARELASRLPDMAVAARSLGTARFERNLAHDDRWEGARGEADLLVQQPAAENRFAFVPNRAIAATIYARLGLPKEALRWLETLLTPLERLPASDNNTMLACLAAHVLWEVVRTDHVEVIESNVREKVVAPDFRFPMLDGRLSLARLCALQGRYDEAVDWFAKARAVLDEQGARPLRAIVDYDEALMYRRRGETGDQEQAAPLLEVALEQFRELGMTGWISRAEALAQG